MFSSSRSIHRQVVLRVRRLGVATNAEGTDRHSAAAGPLQDVHNWQRYPASQRKADRPSSRTYGRTATAARRRRNDIARLRHRAGSFTMGSSWVIRKGKQQQRPHLRQDNLVRSAETPFSPTQVAPQGFVQRRHQKTTIPAFAVRSGAPLIRLWRCGSALNEPLHQSQNTGRWKYFSPQSARSASSSEGLRQSGSQRASSALIEASWLQLDLSYHACTTLRPCPRVRPPRSAEQAPLSVDRNSQVVHIPTLSGDHQSQVKLARRRGPLRLPPRKLGRPPSASRRSSPIARAWRFVDRSRTSDP